MIWTVTRRVTGLLEWVCEHGVGHPDPLCARAVAKALKQPEEVWQVHGCDGCCGRDDFPGRLEPTATPPEPAEHAPEGEPHA